MVVDSMNRSAKRIIGCIMRRDMIAITFPCIPIMDTEALHGLLDIMIMEWAAWVEDTKEDIGAEGVVILVDMEG